MFAKKIMAMLALCLVLVACHKEEEEFLSDPGSEMITPSTSDLDERTELKAGNMTEYMVSPKFGKPNSTYYYFQVYDPSGTLALSVKLYEKATGTTTYLPMTRVGASWTLSKKISINGWYDWRYVYTATKVAISSTPSYQLCNTYNLLSDVSTCAIRWPFSADGSSWSSRTVYINGSSQKWMGGEEGGPGNGWGDGAHTGTDEYYSDDWNRGTGSQDLNAEIRSPLDGKIDAIGSYYVSSLNAYSKYVAIVQETSTGQKYRFYVSHLTATASGLYVGKYVRAGVTKIGTLGMTGATSPHAHTNLRNVTNGASTSVPFYFNAQ